MKDMIEDKMEIEIRLPRPVEKLFEKLEKAGYCAVAVGGCVRDSLMGKIPHDWDMATSATPEEMKQALSDIRLLETGIRHGTLTALTDGMQVEITTFRKDGSYGDGRHPDSVTFSRRLEDDLARRDCTVNAMAYSAKMGVVDLFGGQEDLKNQMLRCGGEPEKRFCEDALRIARAMRFSAVLGFDIEEKTAGAMVSLRERLSLVAVERIWQEWRKLLCGPWAAVVLKEFALIACQVIPELEACMTCKQHNPHHFGTVWEHTLAALENSKPELPVRLAVLLHDIGKPGCFSLDESGIGHFYGHAAESSRMADEICRRLRMDNAIRTRVTTLIRYHDGPIIGNEKLLRRRLRQLGDEAFFQLLEVQKADTMGLAEPYCSERLPLLEETQRKVHKILEEGACFSMKQLAVSGKELMAAGIKPGPEMGKILHRLLEAVSEGEIDNNLVDLLNFAQQIRKKE